MVVKYVAYIDESGDTGLKGVKPKTANGSSEWLIFGCVLVRIENDAYVFPWVRDILQQMRLHQAKSLHFADLSPGKQKFACSQLATKSCRAFVVASNKQNIQNYENPNLTGTKRHWYYWWMTRLLLERVTDFLKRQYPNGNTEEHKLRIVFSQRGRVKQYEELDEYLTKIYWQSKFQMLYLHDFDLDWSFIDFDEITVQPHSKRAGLQLADLVAGSFFQGLERNRPADCDPTCALMFKPILAKDKFRRFLGYGLKTMPDLSQIDIHPNQRVLFEEFGFNSEGWKEVVGPRAS